MHRRTFDLSLQPVSHVVTDNLAVMDEFCHFKGTKSMMLGECARMHNARITGTHIHNSVV